jgi:hypothetical protein
MIRSSYPADWLRQVANPASLISLRANLIVEWHGLRCEKKTLLHYDPWWQTRAVGPRPRPGARLNAQENF